MFVKSFTISLDIFLRCANVRELEVVHMSNEELDGLEKMVDDLIYRSYCHNWQRSPEIHPERWEAVFGPSTAEMEVRYTLDAFAEEIKRTGRVLESLRNTTGEVN
jgi:hypothetical protein